MWKILRKVFLNLSKLNFLQSFKQIKRVIFIIENSFDFTDFILIK
jgi:hypothetical protein